MEQGQTITTKELKRKSIHGDLVATGVEGRRQASVKATRKSSM